MLPPRRIWLSLALSASLLIPSLALVPACADHSRPPVLQTAPAPPAVQSVKVKAVKVADAIRKAGQATAEAQKVEIAFHGQTLNGKLMISDAEHNRIQTAFLIFAEQVQGALNTVKDIATDVGLRNTITAVDTALDRLALAVATENPNAGATLALAVAAVKAGLDVVFVTLS